MPHLNIVIHRWMDQGEQTSAIMKPQAVLLCAGKSTRTYPLTLTKAKPLLKVANRTILEHNLEQLNGLVEEVILVVGPAQDKIGSFCRTRYKQLRISCVEQKEPLGTGHALLQAKEKLKGEFIVMNGDDLYFKEDLRKLLRTTYGALVMKTNHPERFGVYVAERGVARSFVEKPKERVSNLANIGCYKFDMSIFNHKLNLSKRGEYEVTDYVSYLIDKEKFSCVEAERWFPIGYPWDLLEANRALLSKTLSKIEGKVEKNVTIKVGVIIGKNTLVKSGSYIEGPVIIGENSIIGPNAYIRPSTSIGNGCRIGAGVEIKNSIIGDRTGVPHLSYVGDSIIGDYANLGAGSITANSRHDRGVVKSMIKDELVETGLQKFGAVIGDGVKLGIKTLIYPGRKIWPGKTTLPGEIVQKDIM